MAWMDAISEIMNRYRGMGAGTAAAPADPHQDYREIAQTAPREVMADALSHTFRSDQTPNFSDMVASLFRESDPNQRAGLLSHLLTAASPAVLSRIPVLRDLAGGASQGVSAEAANQVSAEQVQQIAQNAQQNNPSIVDRVSGFYAQHPDVVKALGGTAIAIAIQHIVRRR
jgi:hypothetical protein